MRTEFFFFFFFFARHGHDTGFRVIRRRLLGAGPPDIEEEESKVDGGGRRPSCALQYGRPIRRCGRGRPDYHQLAPGCPDGVGLSVRTVFFFFFFSAGTMEFPRGDAKADNTSVATQEEEEEEDDTHRQAYSGHPGAIW